MKLTLVSENSSIDVLVSDHWSRSVDYFGSYTKEIGSSVNSKLGVKKWNVDGYEGYVVDTITHGKTSFLRIVG